MEENRELNSEKNLNRRRYKRLIAQYRNQILQFISDPVKVATELQKMGVITLADLLYMQSLKMHKWQNEVLYEFFLRSDYDQLLRLKEALTNENSRILQIFNSIHEQGQSFMKDVTMRSPYRRLTTDGQPRLSPKEKDPPDDLQDETAPILVTSRLTQVMEAARQRDVEGVIHLFQDVTSMNVIGQWIDEKSGRTPLHLAVMEGDSNLIFVQNLIQLISILCDSQPHHSDLEKNQSSSSSSTSGRRGGRVKKLSDFLNVRDHRGNSALHLAAERQAVEIAKFLYEQKADLTVSNNEGVTPLEIMYETIPEAIVHILNGALPTSVTTDGNSEFILDMLAIIGKPRPKSEAAEADNYGEYVETQLLANMVLGNMDHSSKLILPKLLVTTFLDEKWKKLFGHIFLLTMFYIFVHVLHTYFLIQVFIISVPYDSHFVQTNGSSIVTNKTEKTGQEFYTYLLGNWESPHELDRVIEDTSPLTKLLALLSALAGLLMFVIELIEMLTTAICISSKVKTRRRKYYGGRVSKRKIVISCFIILSSLYGRASGAVLLALILMPLSIYDWTIKTNQSGEKRVKNYKKRKEHLFKNSKLKRKWNLSDYLHLLRILVTMAILIFSFPIPIKPTSWLAKNLPIFPPQPSWATVTFSGLMLVIEVMAMIVQKMGGWRCTCSSLIDGGKTKKRSKGTYKKGDKDSSSAVTTVNLETVPIHVNLLDPQVDTMDPKMDTKCTFCKWKRVWQILNGVFSYSENMENILQLIYSILMIVLSSHVYVGRFTNWLYVAAAFCVVLAWILILLQISNIYGLGKYVHMLRTVVKSFLGLIGIYGSLLLAFSIAFTIIFPHEDFFNTLPSSFFRVVAMMVGEINYDGIFNKENETVNTRPFPYASEWMQLAFIILVSMILVNLLIGLTVSDIQKIQDKSDVIHRSVQVERLYITEKFLQFIHWLFSRSQCCGSCTFLASTFVIRNAGSSLLPICLNQMSLEIRRDFQTLRSTQMSSKKEPPSDDEKDFESDSDSEEYGPGQLPNFGSRLSHQILSGIGKNLGENVQFPLHWLPAMSKKDGGDGDGGDDGGSKKELKWKPTKLVTNAQKRITSIVYKDRLPPTEKNARLLQQFSSIIPSLTSLKEFKISLRSAMKREPIEAWAACRRNFFTILRSRSQHWEKLQIEPSDILPEIYTFPKLTFLTLDVGKLAATTTAATETGGKFLRWPHEFEFSKKFPKVSKIKFMALRSKFHAPNFFTPHLTLDQVRHLQLQDERGVSIETIERVAVVFPKIEQLDVGGSPKWLAEYLPFVWAGWPKLRALTVEIEVGHQNEIFWPKNFVDHFVTGLSESRCQFLREQNPTTGDSGGEEEEQEIRQKNVSDMKDLRLFRLVFKGEFNPNGKIPGGPIFSNVIFDQGFNRLHFILIVIEISVECKTRDREKFLELIQPILTNFKKDPGTDRYVHKILPRQNN